MSTERRAQKRYVIDGLMVELDGDLHETVELSVRACAVVRKSNVNYTQLDGKGRFVCAKVPSLNRPMRNWRHLYAREAIVVIDYVVADDGWEAVLAAHDVRADVSKLEDVLG